MGRLILPEVGPAYVDANAAIYRFEGVEPYSTASAPLWDAIQDRTLLVVTSALTLLEVLVKPIRDGNDQLAATYRRVILETEGLECVAIDRKILNSAAQIRARCRLKTPDAIHAATALHLRTTVFITNDAGFRRVPGLNVVLLDEVVAS